MVSTIFFVLLTLFNNFSVDLRRLASICRGYHSKNSRNISYYFSSWKQFYSLVCKLIRVGAADFEKARMTTTITSTEASTTGGPCGVYDIE